MATRRSTAKSPPIPHVLVGFSFPNQQHPDEVVTGSTRYGIQLSISSQIYAHFVSFYSGDVNDAKAKELADDSFRMANIFLERLDLEAANYVPPAAPPATNNARRP